MIECVSLANWCQHQELQLAFHPGFNALVGRNGAGKSNLLMALLYALTGDTATTGVLADNINEYADPKAPSYVEVRLRRNNVAATIRRDLRPAGRRLEIAGNVCTAAKEVNQALEAYLGAVGPVLSSYVFVPQWRIFHFLEQRDAERAMGFHRLFGTDRLEQVHRALLQVQLDTAAPEESLTWLQQEDVRLLTRLEKVADQLDELPELPENLDETPQAKLLQQGIEQTNLSRLSQQLSERLKKLQEEKTDHERNLEQFQAQLSAMGPGSRVDARYLQQMQQAWAQRRETARKIDVLRQSEDSDPEPPVVAAVDATALATVEAELKIQQRFVETFANDKAVCPVCGTLATALAGQLDEARRQIAQLSQQRQQYRDQQCRYALHSAWAGRHDSRMRELTQLSRWLLDSPEPDLSEAEIQQHLKQLAEQQRRERLQANIDRLVTAHSIISGQIVEVQREYVDNARRLEEIAVLPDKVGQAARWLQEARNQKAQAASLCAERQHLYESLESIRATLRKVQQQVAAAQKEKAIESHLGRLAAVFHWNALPRDMAENYLQLALDGTNDLLAQFDAGFSVEMGSSLGFLARRHGGKPFAATRLSGGEKVLFSLAFRVKVNAMFASDVGLLVLDEPTAGVDEVNITCLERAFTKLRELSSSAGLQVIVVTHEQRLAPLFDHVHELSPPVVAGRRKK